MTEAQKALADNVKRRREQLRLTQGAVAERAEKAGVELTSSYLSRIERGDRKPSFNALAAIAEALNCTASDLLNPDWELPPLPEGF